MILKISTENVAHNRRFGEVIKTGGGFKIAAREGFVLPLRVKLEGKKELDAEAFLRGQRDFIGKTLN